MHYITREAEIRELLAKRPTTQIKENLNKGNEDPPLPDQTQTEKDSVSDAEISHMHQRIAKSHYPQYAISAKRRVTSQKFALAGNQEKSHD